jgi:hypothetical protein
MRQEFHGLKKAVLLTLATSFVFLSCNSSNTTTQPEFKIYSEFAPDYVLPGKTFLLKSAYVFGTGQPNPIKIDWTSQPEITINNTSSNPLIASSSIPDAVTAPLVKITANVKSGDKVFSYTKEIKVIQKNTVSVNIKPDSTDLSLVTEAASGSLSTLPFKNGLVAWGRAYTTGTNQVLRAIRYGSDFKTISAFGTAGVINLPATQFALTNFGIKAFADAQENLYLADFDPFSTKILKISKFDTNGQAVAAFGSGGFVEIPYANPSGQTSYIRNSIFLGQDDYIYVVKAGNLSRYSTQTGSLDASFGTGGQYSLVAGFIPNCLTTDSQGRIIIAGDFFRNGYALRYPIAIRIAKTGVIDASFAKKGILEIVSPDINIRDAFGTFNNVSTRANDGLLFTEISGLNLDSSNYAAVLAQFKSDGTPDLAFGSEGRAVIGAKGYNEFSILNLKILNDNIYIFSPTEVMEFGSNGALTKYSGVSYVGNPTEGPREIGTAVKISLDRTLSVFGILCSQFSSCGDQYAFATVRF